MKVPTPSIGGRTLLVQLGGVFFDKTLAEGPSAAPVRFCFMAHGSHRFIVCSVQVSPRGPHRNRCATNRGPPCKQGATIATLHFTISVLLFCQISPPGLWALLPPPGPFSLSSVFVLTPCDVWLERFAINPSSTGLSQTKR